MRTYPESARSLIRAGIDCEDAIALRRISMTLRSWHERECGNEYGCIDYDEDGKPFWLYSYKNKKIKSPIRNLYAGAMKRLNKIMENYPDLRYYIQGDPRGCALYIIRPGDVPAGEDVDAYYSRGISVYQ